MEKRGSFDTPTRRAAEGLRFRLSPTVHRASPRPCPEAAFIKPYLFSVFRFAMVLVVFGAVSFFIASVSLDAAINRLVGKLQNLVGMEAPYRTLDEIHELAMNIALQDRWMQWLNFWYMMMLLVKCGEDLPVSPRLMVFVHTLREASGSIFYFVIFFFIVFSNFAMGAHFLFGHILYEWSADALPFVSTFRVLMGDFDFMAMYAIAPVSSMIWFSLFAVFVYLILVNLFISIVSESYYTVYNSVMLTNEEDVIQKYASNISSSISSALSRPRMLSYAAWLDVATCHQAFLFSLRSLRLWFLLCTLVRCLLAGVLCRPLEEAAQMDDRASRQLGLRRSCQEWNRPPNALCLRRPGFFFVIPEVSFICGTITSLKKRSRRRQKGSRRRQTRKNRQLIFRASQALWKCEPLQIYRLSKSLLAADNCCIFHVASKRRMLPGRCCEAAKNDT